MHRLELLGTTELVETITSEIDIISVLDHCIDLPVHVDELPFYKKQHRGSGGSD